MVAALVCPFTGFGGIAQNKKAATLMALAALTETLPQLICTTLRPLSQAAFNNHDRLPRGMVVVKDAKTGNVGVCRLCQAHAALCNSHLLPAGVFRILRKTQTKNPSLVFFAEDGKAFTSSRELKQYLLCQRCENRFSRCEKWVLAHCRQSSKTFPLRDILLLLSLRPFTMALSFTQGQVLPASTARNLFTSP